MTAAILIALLAQADIDSLIRDLDADTLEVRDRAHRALIAKGPSIAPALRGALKSGDEEFRIRANFILDAVERGERERVHDLEEKEALLLLRRSGKPQAELGEGDTEGARFQVSASPFDGGWIIRTQVQDFLRRRVDSGPGRSQLQFDVKSVNELPIERCGACSPRLVYVKAPPGPLKVRLTGEHVWFSPYHLEFKDPVAGQKRRVGEFTVEVVDFSLKVTSTSFPADWFQSMEPTCSLELRTPKTARKYDGIT